MGSVPLARVVSGCLLEKGLTEMLSQIIAAGGNDMSFVTGSIVAGALAVIGVLLHL